MNWFRLDARSIIWHAEDSGRPLKKNRNTRFDKKRGNVTPLNAPQFVGEQEEALQLVA